MKCMFQKIFQLYENEVLAFGVSSFEENDNLTKSHLKKLLFLKKSYAVYHVFSAFTSCNWPNSKKVKIYYLFGQ